LSEGQGSALPPEPPTRFCADKRKTIMARPTKPEAVKLTKTIRCRVTDGEFLKHEESAKIEGLTLTDFVRSRLDGAKPRRKKANPERLALIAALGTLGNIRSDINQLLKDRHAHRFTKPVDVKNVFTAIEKIADQIQINLSDGGS